MIYENEESEDLWYLPEIVSIRKKNRRIRIDEIRKNSSEIENISSEIRSLTRKVFKSLHGDTVSEDN